MPYTGPGVVRWRGSSLPNVAQNLNMDASTVRAITTMKHAISRSRGVLLTGPTGTGKSTLLNQYARDLKTCHPTMSSSRKMYTAWLDEKVWWTQGVEFMEDTKKAIGISQNDPKWSEDYQPLGIASQVSILFVDDFGSGMMSEYAKSIWEALIDARYRANLPIHISTNLSIADIHRSMGARVSSRLQGMCDIIEMQGADRRLALAS